MTSSTSTNPKFFKIIFFLQDMDPRRPTYGKEFGAPAEWVVGVMPSCWPVACGCRMFTRKYDFSGGSAREWSSAEACALCILQTHTIPHAFGPAHPALHVVALWAPAGCGSHSCQCSIGVADRGACCLSAGILSTGWLRSLRRSCEQTLWGPEQHGGQRQ